MIKPKGFVLGVSLVQVEGIFLEQVVDEISQEEGEESQLFQFEGTFRRVGYGTKVLCASMFDADGNGVTDMRVYKLI